MLASIFYGAMYGGTITSVLINTPVKRLGDHLPGRISDGQAGTCGVRAAIAAIGSFVGGTIPRWGFVLVALPLTRFALRFGPPEFFALMLVGLSLVTGLAGRSLIRALLSAVWACSSRRWDRPRHGAPRFTFGRMELLDGFGIVPVVMGVFGIGRS